MKDMMGQLFEALKNRRLMMEVSLWGLFWSVAMTFSVGIFGHIPALVTIAMLAGFTSCVWYRTGKRDERRMEVARSRNVRRRG
ncbi:hypothetical protein [Rubrobacter indicoceani]|uniref:hypothetical protein n=1 Tax=Rubrobacter indicoceani TaxID=2051957 RepID=UPI000E5BD875|nr:hypothetical protein [Rubrobacter indicoceani]